MSRSAGWMESDVRAPEQHHSLRGRRWLKDPAVLCDFPMAPLVFFVLSQALRQGAFLHLQLVLLPGDGSQAAVCVVEAVCEREIKKEARASFFG